MTEPVVTLLPVGLGIVVVVLATLVLRLHPFLALLLAALCTGFATPTSAWLHERLAESAIPFQWQSDSPRRLGAEGVDVAAASSEGEWALVRNGEAISNVRIVSSAGSAMSVLAVESADALPSDLLLKTADYETIRVRKRPHVFAEIAVAFGVMVGKIGFLIAFAAIIGRCLLDAGAADRIIRSALATVGERNAPLAFAGSGFLLAIPVFFDTVFLLMIPLGKAMRMRTGRNYLLYVLTIFCGATMAHSLVPPTPGPLLVAEELNVDIGIMIAVGGAVGLVTAAFGMLYAALLNRLVDVPLRDTDAEMPITSDRDVKSLPPLWLSLLPVLLPITLIGLETAMSLLVESKTLGPPPQWMMNAIGVLGEKNTALALGVAAALYLFVRQTHLPAREVRERVQSALAGGAVIILITAAGGAFGEMIAGTGVTRLIRQLPDWGPIALLLLAFGVTTLLRTIQGSATVAMITSVGLFGGLPLPFHPVWLAVAIGCGSKPLSWMTDSGFWVICKTSGMTESETLKTLTPMSGLMGITGLVAVLIGATLWPMA